VSLVGAIVRWIHPVTDVVTPYSFNRTGFALNRRGFVQGDTPRDTRGRIALVAGASSDMGRATSLQLARLGFEVWMLRRDVARGAEASDAVARDSGSERVHVRVVDVSSLGSSRRFVRDSSPERIDVLVHSAGVLPDRKRLTANGAELTFATNVLGPVARTALVMDRRSRSGDARVLFVVSGGLYLQRLDLSLLDVEPAHFDRTRAYANAKRAQVVLPRVLAQRSGDRAAITSASMHPGWADTTAVRTSLPKCHARMKHFLRTAEQGADTVVWLAASDRPRGSRGSVWFDRRIAPEYPTPGARESPDARERLVRLCEQTSGVTFARRQNEAA